MPQDAKQAPDTSVRHDSEAPKSGVRMIKTQPGLGTRAIPRPASKPDLPRPPSTRPAPPPAPVSRPGRAAVRQRSVPPVIAPPPSVPSLRAPAQPPASGQSAPHALRDGLPPAPSSNHSFRSLTTTAQDWPIAPVELPVQSRGPTFGHRPPGASEVERFSLPAFLPPVGMQVTIHAANDGDADYAALDAAFSVRPTPAPAPFGPRLPAGLVFAAGIAVGVIATLLLH